jgi:(5-formylfuran-3-yl)methyl phosphate synthase
LRAAHALSLAQLAPDFAGFRTAVCADGRAGALDAARLHALRDALLTSRHRNATV